MSLRQFQAVDHVEHGLDMTVWQRACDAEGVVEGNEIFAFEHSADELNLAGRGRWERLARVRFLTFPFSR